MCLVAIELLCPVLCSPIDTLASNLSMADVAVSKNAESDITTASMSGCDHESEADESADCVDECLCHAVAIPVIAINNRSADPPSGLITGRYKTNTSNSLSTPYLPPKFS